MNVHWTDSALTDLQAVEAYIARRSPLYAQGVADRIFRRSSQLETHPQLGVVVPEYADETIRELFEHPYRLVYRVGDGQIDIVAVVHSARRMPHEL